MSNFDQFEYKKSTKKPVRTKDIESQQQWLTDHLHYLQRVETYNQLIREIFVCHKCGKRITNSQWVHNLESSETHEITHYYHAKRQCNPQFTKTCLICDKSFRINRKNQKLCSKKCSVKYMTSPILLKRCETCGMEFKVRIINNKKNKEKKCLRCR